MITFAVTSIYWFILGCVFILLEFLIPGLVVVFLGLGSLTVASLVYSGHLETVSSQLLTFFVSSFLYLVTLRFLLLRWIPQDTEKKEISDDNLSVGRIVQVSEPIKQGKEGRILFEDSSWSARSENPADEISEGEMVKIVGRDNITYIVSKNHR